MKDLTGLLWQALTAEVGLEVVTNNPEGFKRKFYTERAKAREQGNFSFDELSLILPPSDKQHNKVWIVHNGQVQRTEEGNPGEEES